MCNFLAPKGRDTDIAVLPDIEQGGGEAALGKAAGPDTSNFYMFNPSIHPYSCTLISVAFLRFERTGEPQETR